MKQGKENRKSALSEFQRYIRGEMTKREENAFQRKLQRDPFADEATEGYSGISSREATDDLNLLAKKLKSRISGRQRILFYRIAASIAILMILSTVYLVIRQTRPSDRINDLSVVTVPANKQKQEALNKPEVAESTDNQAFPENKSEQPGNAGIQDTSTVKGFSDRKELPLSAGIEDKAITAEKKDSDIYPAKEEMAVSAAAITKAEKQADTGKIQIDIQPPAAGLGEVTTIGYGTKKSAVPVNAVVSRQGDITSLSDNRPQPVNGQADFDRYIVENIQQLDSLATGQRVVVVSFIVRSSGSLDSLKVVSSPGQEYSDEALRLIRNGPAWKPARENGINVDNEVSLRIVFK